ncbi:MAG TPA: ATP-dependent DNA ligase [Actinomycetota bacterium]|nr:ATP-dependent DNA ligase [Actinomycetota bacterium]
MKLPIAPPIAPMLAKLREEMPTGEGWLYEPKWDGFRAIVWRDGSEVSIQSRDTRPIDRYFPELVEPLCAALPDRCVVDGEIVVAGPEGLEFDALLLRIHPAQSRVKMLAQQTPASFVAFDLLAEGADSLMETPFSERRTRLEGGLPDPDPEGRALESASGRSIVFLTPQTADPVTARNWFDQFENVGLDGIIAKEESIHYLPGERAMVKIKHRRTADCVVGGFRMNKTNDGIGSLLLGLFDGAGVLHYVGHTSSFKAPERRRLLGELRELEGEGGFGSGRTPGGPSRWTGGRDTTWVALRPELVCEVSYDHMQGDRFRHAATFVRWRPEKPARECGFEQLGTRTQ